MLPSLLLANQQLDVALIPSASVFSICAILLTLTSVSSSDSSAPKSHGKPVKVDFGGLTREAIASFHSSIMEITEQTNVDLCLFCAYHIYTADQKFVVTDSFLHLSKN